MSGGLGGGAGPGGAGGDAPPGSGGTFTGTGTTVQGIFIPGAHPRLFWTPARIAAAKKWWTSNSFTPRNDVYSVADQLFAYIASGNQTYCTQAIGFSMAVNLSDCVATKAGCDEARWDGETAILTYDWCYSVMTAAQRTTFQTNWNTWLNNVRAQDWGGVGQSQSNYYWGTVRDEIEWAIASYQENQTAADAFLTDAITTRYLNDFVPATMATGQAMGGLGLEGGQYGPYQSYYMSAIVLPSLASSGRDMWTEATPYWKGAVLNRIYMTPPMPTVTVNKQRAGWEVFPFGDDETWQDGAPAQATEKGTFMTAAADRWSGSNIGRWAQRWLMNVSPNVDKALASSVTAGSPQDFAFLPLDYYDAGPRYLMGRNNWTTAATTWLWQMGDHYSDGHNHDDWGGFQINRKGRWLTRETAGYTESVAGFGGTGSVQLYTALAHNVPIINGNGGVPTRGFPPAKGQEGSWTSSPVVHRLESKPGYSYGDVDLTGAYHCCVGGTSSGDNAAAVHVEREYWFVRDIETTVVLDRLQSDTAARSKTFVVHCETNPVAGRREPRQLRQRRPAAGHHDPAAGHAVVADRDQREHGRIARSPAAKHAVPRRDQRRAQLDDQLHAARDAGDGRDGHAPRADRRRFGARAGDDRHLDGDHRRESSHHDQQGHDLDRRIDRHQRDDDQPARRHPGHGPRRHRHAGLGSLSKLTAGRTARAPPRAALRQIC